MQDSSALAQGIRCLQAGDYQTAGGWFAQAVSENPADGRAHGYLGICQVQAGDLARGVASLQQAVMLQPNSADPLYNLAVALNQAGRQADSRAALERALTLDPTHAKARAALQAMPAMAAAAVGPPKAAPVAGYGATLRAHGDPAPPPPAYPGAYLAQTSVLQGLRVPPPSTVARAAPIVLEPPTGLRIGRGLGWGAVYGQAFTGWVLLRLLLFAGMTTSSSVSGDSAALMGMGMVIVAAVGTVAMAVLGALIGLIIGAANMDDDAGGVLGIVGGVAVMGLQYLVGLRSAVGLVFGIVLAIGLGRYVGQGIANKVQQPPPA